ncbi:hypothetical protein LI328DRAFT_166697 [Trichoderma asperelloides]|nr:hypothetical protein LI328DRAFT_166697 [Trichoderma asperelloides]
MNQLDYDVERDVFIFNGMANGDIIASNDLGTQFIRHDIACLQLDVATLRLEVGELKREQRLLKDNLESLRRSNRRRRSEIIDLQDENDDTKEECQQLQQENRILQRKNREFRAAMDKLQTTVKTHNSFIPRIQELLKALNKRR